MRLTDQNKTFEWAPAPAPSKPEYQYCYEDDHEYLSGAIYVSSDGLAITAPRERHRTIDYGRPAPVIQVAPENIDKLIEGLRIARAAGIEMYGREPIKTWMP